MVCIDYNENTMKFVYYQNGEIEIVEGELPNRKWIFHFRNVWELAESIKKARPELANQLKEIL